MSLGVLLLDLLLLFFDGDLEVRLEGGEGRGDLDLFFFDFLGERDLFFRGDLLLDRDLDRGIVKTVVVSNKKNIGKEGAYLQTRHANILPN